MAKHIENKLSDFVKVQIEKVEKLGGNAQNLRDAELLNIASFLDDYAAGKHIPEPMDPGYLSEKTRDLFQEFVQSWSQDEIEGNNVKNI